MTESNAENNYKKIKRKYQANANVYQRFVTKFLKMFVLMKNPPNKKS